jgi:SAM-dependent methyltransferase
VTRIADRYPGGSPAARAYRALRLRLGGLRRIAGLFPREGTIVDLGCGMGLLAHLLVEERPARRVLAVDHDPARVAQLAGSATGLAIEARCADMASVAIPPCAGVALVDVLHYLDADAQEALLARAAAALEPGGVLVLRDPDRAAFLRYRVARLHEAVALRSGFTKARHGHYRSGRAWAALLVRHGLEAERLPLGWFSPYPDRVVVGRKP